MRNRDETEKVRELWDSKHFKLRGYKINLTCVLYLLQYSQAQPISNVIVLAFEYLLGFIIIYKVKILFI